MVSSVQCLRWSEGGPPSVASSWRIAVLVCGLVLLWALPAQAAHDLQLDPSTDPMLTEGVGSSKRTSTYKIKLHDETPTQDVTVSVDDDETAALVGIPPSQTLSESSGATTYTVRLDTPPTVPG